MPFDTPHGLELRHLRYFVAVAEQLHFARAAESLDIAPPTLTVNIQELERLLQVRLLQRSRSAVSLTPAGELFLPHALSVLGHAQQALHVGRRAARGELGRVEIGYVGSAVFSGLLQSQLRAYRAAWPDVLVTATEHPMDKLPELLLQGRLDLAFARLPMALPAALTSHVLSHDRFCLAVPAEHALAQAKKPVRAQALAGQPFVVPEQDWGLRELARRGRFTPLIGSTPGSLLAVLSQVSVGAGVAVVPQLLAPALALPNVVWLELAGPPIVSQAAALYRRYEQAPAVMHWIDQLTAGTSV